MTQLPARKCGISIFRILTSIYRTHEPPPKCFICICVITVVSENTLLPPPHENRNWMNSRVKGPGCLHRAPASTLTMLRKFQKHDDKNFGGKTIRIVKHKQPWQNRHASKWSCDSWKSRAACLAISHITVSGRTCCRSNEIFLLDHDHSHLLG